MPFDKELLQRVREELESEGVSNRDLLELSQEALIELARRIAARLRRSVEEIWEATIKLGQSR